MINFILALILIIILIRLLWPILLLICLFIMTAVVDIYERMPKFFRILSVVLIFFVIFKFIVS